MPFRFSALCELFEKLEKLETRDPPYLRGQKEEESRKTLRTWFSSNRRALDAPDTNAVAVLSTLFPERRKDRIYGIQAQRLCKIASRCLRLNNEKLTQVLAWKLPGNGDLGACVERVLKDTDACPRPGTVTVEEVDHALQELAGKCRFSSFEIRRDASAEEPLDLLEPIFLKCYSSEAKWLVRLILKDLSPVILDEYRTLHEFHFLLPDLLRFQDSFSAAIGLLKGPLKRYHAKPDPQSQRILREEAAKKIYPIVGIKVGRPRWEKARSMRHCLSMAGGHRWMAERKYDGEYCEIHVDLSKGHNCIQIYSKSGRDSTEDRVGLHAAIRQSLRLGEPDCRIKQKCILLGEMLVWSDKEQKILEFHKIRKHVSRAGSFIGADQDSQAHPHEHLMIVYFDLLLHDNDVVMKMPYMARRKRLADVVTKITGVATTSERCLLDFSRPSTIRTTLLQFAVSLYHGYEGLILKPCDAPYYSLEARSAGVKNFYIKLKKDYMQDMGSDRDVADFAVIGANYDANQAQRCKLKRLRWTDFHLGCLTNKPAVLRFGSRSAYRLVATIKQDKCIPDAELQGLNDHGQFRAEPYSSETGPKEFDLVVGLGIPCRIDHYFRDPMVVEVLGSSFDKPANEGFYMLRHPRVLKLHLDRSWRDTVSLEELQELAEQVRDAPDETDELNTATEVAKLMRRYSRRLLREGRTQSILSQKSTQATSVLSSPASAKKAASTPRKHASPPILIRTDTKDLLPGEVRQKPTSVLPSTTFVPPSTAPKDLQPTSLVPLRAEPSSEPLDKSKRDAPSHMHQREAAGVSTTCTPGGSRMVTTVKPLLTSVGLNTPPPTHPKRSSAKSAPLKRLRNIETDDNLFEPKRPRTAEGRLTSSSRIDQHNVQQNWVNLLPLNAAATEAASTVPIGLGKGPTVDRNPLPSFRKTPFRKQLPRATPMDPSGSTTPEGSPPSAASNRPPTRDSTDRDQPYAQTDVDSLASPQSQRIQSKAKAVDNNSEPPADVAQTVSEEWALLSMPWAHSPQNHHLTSPVPNEITHTSVDWDLPSSPPELCLSHPSQSLSTQAEDEGTFKAHTRSSNSLPPSKGVEIPGPPCIQTTNSPRSGHCIYAAHEGSSICALANSSVHLAPGIAAFTWLAERLLPSHGCLVEKDFDNWLSPGVPPGADSQASEIADSQERKEKAERILKPKMLLVESNLTADVTDMIGKVKAALGKMNVHPLPPQWEEEEAAEKRPLAVAVCDWRVAEAWAQAEMRMDVSFAAIESAFLLGTVVADDDGRVIWIEGETFGRMVVGEEQLE